MGVDDLKANLEALRERMASDFRKEKAYLQQLFESAPEAIAVMDLQGKILHVNREFTHLFGYEADEAEGRTLAELVTPDILLKQDRWTLERAVEGQRTVVETLRRRRDGGQIHVSLITGSIDAEGKPVNLYAILRDITRRRTMEEELRKEKAYLEQLFENAQEGLVMADNEGTVLHVNTEFEKMFGYSRAEAAGRNIDDLLAPEDALDVARAFTQGVSQGQRVAFESVRRRKDGTDVHVSILAAPIFVEGVQAGVYGIYRDVTERLRLQERLQKSQKMESLGVLAGGIGHDFNNILMAVLGNAELALRRLGPDEPLRRHLEGIEEAAREAAGLVRQMLAYSGRASHFPQVLSLADLAARVVKAHAVSGSDRFRIEQDFDPHAPPVEADPGQASQVVVNLLTNAAEALGDAGGRITLRTGLRRLDRDALLRLHGTDDLAEGDYAFLEVEDDGPGMEPAVAGRLFDPFFTTKFTGRGLGLSAVLGILQTHGGAVEVKSEPGRGSAFAVYFPPAGEEAPAGEPRPEGEEDADGPGDPIRGCRALVVDDEAMVLHVAGQILTELGCEVTTAASGEEAVEIFGRDPDAFDLAILDLAMPGMDGAQCMDALRRRRPGLPVLLASGFTEEYVADECEDRADVGVLEKPFTLEELRSKLRQALAGPGAPRPDTENDA